MALVKHYKRQQYRAPNPQRPGSTVLATRHIDSGTHTLVHEGVEYYADEDGWFDLPDHVAAEACRPGVGWMTPMDVEEHINAGLIKDTPTIVDPGHKPRSEAHAQVSGGANKAPVPEDDDPDDEDDDEDDDLSDDDDGPITLDDDSEVEEVPLGGKSKN